MDLAFVNNKILPYYISNKWLTKAPPSGQKFLGDLTILFSFYLSRLGKRERQDYRQVPTRIRTTTVMKDTVKKWGIVSKAWQVA